MSVSRVRGSSGDGGRSIGETIQSSGEGEKEPEVEHHHDEKDSERLSKSRGVSCRQFVEFDWKRRRTNDARNRPVRKCRRVRTLLSRLSPFDS